MLLYIIRHGDPNYALDCLTERGKSQARALAGRLAASGLDKIFSSPQGRARETAEPTCKLLNLACGVEDWAAEDLAWRDFSVADAKGNRKWSFLCQNTLLKEDPLALNGAWHDMSFFNDCRDAKGGYERIARASDGFMARLGYLRENFIYKIIEHSEEKVALFCHGGMGSILLSHLLGVPPPVFWAGFAITHTGVTILEFLNNPDGYTAPRCLAFSDTSHLLKEGLPVEYQY